MSFTPGHKEPSFSLLQHKWFGHVTYIKQLCSDINVAQVIYHNVCCGQTKHTFPGLSLPETPGKKF